MKKARKVLCEQIIEVIEMIESDMQDKMKTMDDDTMDVIYIEIVSLKNMMKIIQAMNDS